MAWRPTSDKQLSNQWWSCFVMHICVSRPQYVKARQWIYQIMFLMHSATIWYGNTVSINIGIALEQQFITEYIRNDTKWSVKSRWFSKQRSKKLWANVRYHMYLLGLIVLVYCKLCNMNWFGGPILPLVMTPGPLQNFRFDYDVLDDVYRKDVYVTVYLQNVYPIGLSTQWLVFYLSLLIKVEKLHVSLQKNIKTIHGFHPLDVKY